MEPAFVFAPLSVGLVQVRVIQIKFAKMQRDCFKTKFLLLHPLRVSLSPAKNLS
jgi:hypothetical protein